MVHFTPILKCIDFISFLAWIIPTDIINDKSNAGFLEATTSPTFSLELRGVGLSLRSFVQRLLAARRKERWGNYLSDVFEREKKQLSNFDILRLGWQTWWRRGPSRQLFLCMMWDLKIMSIWKLNDVRIKSYHQHCNALELTSGFVMFDAFLFC